MSKVLSIVRELEAARESRNWTQAQLAERAGASRMTVSRIESGFDPRLTTLHELARALGFELMLVPAHLRPEVEAFVRSGGRMLAQPAGANAPRSVIDLAGDEARKESKRGVHHGSHRESSGLSKNQSSPANEKRPGPAHERVAADTREPGTWPQPKVFSGYRVESRDARETGGASALGTPRGKAPQVSANAAKSLAGAALSQTAQRLFQRRQDNEPSRSPPLPPPRRDNEGSSASKVLKVFKGPQSKKKSQGPA